MCIARRTRKIVIAKDNFFVSFCLKPKRMRLFCKENLTGTLNNPFCHFAATIWTLHIFHSFVKFKFTDLFTKAYHSVYADATTGTAAQIKLLCL